MILFGALLRVIFLPSASSNERADAGASTALKAIMMERENMKSLKRICSILVSSWRKTTLHSPLASFMYNAHRQDGNQIKL